MRDLVRAAEDGQGDPQLTGRKLCAQEEDVGPGRGWWTGPASWTGMETSVGDVRPGFESGKCFNKKCLFIHVMFLTAVGFCCYMQAFSSCSHWELLLIVVCGLLYYKRPWMGSRCPGSVALLQV